MKKIISAALVVLLLFSLAACGKKGEKDASADTGSNGSGEAFGGAIQTEADGNIAAVLILGKHANARDNFTQKLRSVEYREFMKKCCVKYMVGEKYTVNIQFGVIIADGRPTVETLSPETEIASPNEPKVDKLVGNYFGSLTDWIDGLRPQDEEADLLAAISQARDYLLGFPNAAEKHILILDPGFLSSGYLDFTAIPDFQEQTADAIVNKVPEGYLPDLSGFRVTFEGLGNAGGNQKTLENQKFKNLMEDVWKKLFTGMRCGDVDIRYSPLSGDAIYPGGDYPFVTPVHIRDENRKFFETLTINFVGKSAEFKEPERAETQILNAGETFLSVLESNPDEKLYIVASIANDPPESEYETNSVSRDRAIATADVLTKKIDRDRLVLIDAGTTDLSWRVYEKDNRIWTEKEAKQAFNETNDDTLLNNVQSAHRLVVCFTREDAAYQEIEEKGLLEGAHVIPY